MTAPRSIAPLVRVRFGLDLDGARCWKPANRLGDVTLGPLGFLGLLETQLGLRGKAASEAERVVAYRGALDRVDSDARFFHRSLQADALGTAATLLEWRDTWCLHGWDGTVPAGAGSRLQDMAAVERELDGVLTACLGERLQRIAAVLALRPVAIGGVTVVDPQVSLPLRWREVLARLPVEFVPPAFEGAKPAGLLGELQQALRPALSGATPAGAVAWRDDGTLCVVRAETRLLAAEWLRGPLRNNGHGTLIVADRHGVCLDESLVRHGLARNGFREVSTFRPATQVLPLALELLWDPVDIDAVVQFLTHPVCPLPRYAARRIAGKLVERPGVSGAAWEATLAAIDVHYGERAAAVRAELRTWVECARYTRAAGAPRAAVLARTEAIREYLRGRLAAEDRAERAAFAAAHAQATTIVRSLQGYGAASGATVSPRQLEQLLAQSVARGLPHPLVEPELGSAGVAASPAAVIESADTVVWWQMAAPSLPARDPWSRAEIAQLRDAGVQLPDPGETLKTLAASWLRPVFAARQQLVLVLAPESEESHPLWLMLKDLLPGVAVTPLENLLRIPVVSTDTAPMVPRPLPSRRRWWRLDRDTPIPMRETESYSSLNLLLNDPSQWVLQYPARLSRSEILSIPDRSRLFGNLSHRLVERLYRNPDVLRWSAADVGGWFDEHFPRVIAEEGATLRMPGERAYLAGFRSQLRASVLRLHRALLAADVVAVEPEAALSGRHDGGPLTGSADLRVTRGDGRSAIIDMKWSGTTRYRERLARNGHLQLVIYAVCARDRDGQWPHVAYLVLDAGELLVREPGFFPDARQVPPSDQESIDAVWARHGVSWHWRAAQLRAGEIEVVCDDIAPDEALLPPADGLELETLGERYNAFRHLRGWAR